MPVKIKTILFLITLSEIGGASKYVLDLARELRKTKRIIVAAGGNPDGQLFQEIKKINEENTRPGSNPIRYISLQHVQRSTGLLREFRALAEIRALIKAERPDIIHLNSTKIGGLGGIAGILENVPSVYTVHGLVLNDPWPWYAKIFYWCMEKIAFFSNTHIISVSEFDARSIRAHHLAPKRKITVIHNVPHPETLTLYTRDAARKELFDRMHIPPQNRDSLRIVGSIAGHYPPKDIPTGIAAAKHILHRLSGVVFLNIGDGPESPHIKKYIKECGMEHHFFLLGGIPTAARLLSGFDVFFLSSVKEGYPYTLLEAGSAGIPVVTTAVGGIPEIARAYPSWKLVPTKHPSILADRVCEALQEISKHPHTAPLHIVDTHAIFQQFIEETTDVYTTLAG